jgi:hypothetical protein
MDTDLLKTLLVVSNDDTVDITIRDLPEGIRNAVADLYKRTGSSELGFLRLNLSTDIALRMSLAIDEGNKAIDEALDDSGTNVLSLNWVQRLVFKIFFKKGEDYVF